MLRYIVHTKYRRRQRHADLVAAHDVSLVWKDLDTCCRTCCSTCASACIQCESTLTRSFNQPIVLTVDRALWGLIDSSAKHSGVLKRTFTDLLPVHVKLDSRALSAKGGRMHWTKVFDKDLWCQDLSWWTSALQETFVHCWCDHLHRVSKQRWDLDFFFKK